MMHLFRKWRINRRLKATLKPDPAYRERKLAQFTTERRERYFDNLRKAGL